MAHVVTQEDYGPQGLNLTGGGFLGQLAYVFMHIGQSDSTQFVGYTKVARVYTAHFTIKNQSNQQITITIFHDPERPDYERPSSGWQTHIGPGQTGTYTTRWTTVFAVGGNSGAAPPSESEGLVHPFFKHNGKSFPIVKNDAFIWDGTHMLKQQVVG
jgi:hypothetical protein